MLLNDVDRSIVNKKFEDAFSARRSLGHYAKKGKQWSSSGGAGNNEIKSFRGVCHYCHERGFYARDCLKRNSN